MGARQADIDQANDPKNKLKQQGMVMNRTCTDTICCLIFFAFIVAMAGVSYWGIQNGDVNRILTPFDSDGNQCGLANQGKSNGDARDFTNFPFKFYDGLMKSATGGSSGNEKYNAICVASCPSGLPPIASFSQSNAQKLDCMTNNDVNDCPYATFNTTQFLSLCLPEPESTMETLN